MSGFDHWIQDRYWWLFDEHFRLGGGAIGRQCLKAISAQYAEYLYTGRAVRQISDLGRDRNTFTTALPAQGQQLKNPPLRS